jgi:putative transposase
MLSHVHLIAVPHNTEGLGRAIGEAHRSDTLRINFRENWLGHLWQERFASFPMDERYLLATASYIEMNLVAAKVVRRPEEYPWSTAQAHLKGKDEKLVKVAPLLQLIHDWAGFLQLSSQEEVDTLNRHERTGRILGEKGFVENLEKTLGRILRQQKTGPKKQEKS